MFTKVDKLRIILGFSLFFCLFGGIFFAQDESLLGDIDLSKASYTWLSVTSGKAVARPLRTSYGWLDLTEGKMASAIGESGRILWQKGLPAQALPLASAARQDFAYVPLKNKKLCLLNQSGVVLWQRPLDFDLLHPPLYGRDGRAFVFGKSEAACFGMNGVQKWKAAVEAVSPSVAPVQLNDGSVLVFLEALQDGKTCALRLSPFGETMERIVFSARAAAAASVESGAVLCFEDGSAGLCSAGKGGGLQSAWTLKDAVLGRKVLFAALDGADKIALASSLGSGTKVTVLDAKKARAEASFFIPEIQSPLYFVNSADGLFAAGEASAAIYSAKGKKVRAISFPAKSKKSDWDYVLYGNSGTIVFTSRNWNATGYKILKSGAAPKSSEKEKSYKDFYKGQSEDFSRIRAAASLSRKEALLAGNYGAAEKDFLFDSDWILNDWFAAATSASSVRPGADGFSDGGLFSFSLREWTAAISSLGLFGGGEQSKTLARVLSLAKDESVLYAALKAVQECGYDPSGALLDSIELLAKSASPKQEALLQELCAALYSVCRFMGRPALNKKGLAILQNLQLPQHSEATKEAARKVYEKLAQLKL